MSTDPKTRRVLASEIVRDLIAFMALGPVSSNRYDITGTSGGPEDAVSLQVRVTRPGGTPVEIEVAVSLPEE